MSKSDTCKYATYRLAGLPAGVFGETYVIAAAMAEGTNVYRCEYFLLTKRDEPHFLHEAFTFEGDVPEELLKLDLDYLVGESRQQAENYLSERLFQIAEKKGRPNLLEYRYELVEMPYMPLHGCWMRGEFMEETRKIVEATRCGQLKRYLSLLVRSSFTRRPG